MKKEKNWNRLEDTCLESPGRSRWPSNAVENYKVRAIVECNPAIIRWSNYHKKGSNFTQCPLFSPIPFPLSAGHGCSSVDAGRSCTWSTMAPKGRAPIDFHDFSISFQ